ncbi:MAG: hypothetical protein MUP47_00425 [Phycisphaerae bacterium]|nr:hypothetical protein [Phycisphaerae bacterium]
MRSKPDATSPAAEPRGPGAGSLVAAVARCRADEKFLAAIRALYARVDATAPARGWVCKACGACCDFAASAHRLYVSTGELALLTAARPPHPPGPTRCPYQVDARCTVHPVRALGCRLFFCDARAREAFQQKYETAHREIRRLHDAAGLPYLYAELTAALAQLFPAPPC